MATMAALPGETLVISIRIAGAAEFCAVEGRTVILVHGAIPDSRLTAYGSQLLRWREDFTVPQFR